jgi:hypothetical protein
MKWAIYCFLLAILVVFAIVLLSLVLFNPSSIPFLSPKMTFAEIPCDFVRRPSIPIYYRIGDDQRDCADTHRDREEAQNVPSNFCRRALRVALPLVDKDPSLLVK